MLSDRSALRLVGRVLAGYFRLVAKTSPLIDPLGPSLTKARDHAPAIFTFWHGEQFMIPTMLDKSFDVSILVSRNKDGEIQAAALEQFGFYVVRGSGGRNRHKTLAKGGVKASVELLHRLKAGHHVAMTANVPHGPARHVGKGVVTLGKLSGRPILPVCHLTSRNIVLNSWDQSVINLPFSKAVVMVGEPIWVGCEGDETALEMKRLELEAELIRINHKARTLLGIADSQKGEAPV